MEPTPTLIVFNQDFHFPDIKSILQGKSRRLIVLTSHELFRNEREDLNRMGFEEVLCLSFSDLLTDAELAQIDNDTSSALTGTPPTEYFARFRDSILYKRNEAAYSKIKERFAPVEAFVYTGLGISADFWKRQKCQILNPPSFFSMVVRKWWGVFNRVKWYVDVHEINVVDAPEVTYAFWGSVRRLNFTSGVNTAKRSYLNFRHGLKRTLTDAAASKKRVIPATTIHGFRDQRLYAIDDLNVFVDGFHPPNYTRSHIDMFGDPVFVTRNMFDEQWFKENGKRTAKAPAFIKQDFMRPVLKPGSIKNVYLLLNHAGDWTALINRSDTDRLISQFTSLAMEFSELNFTIRTHPTMVHPEHEGAGSKQRIMDFVAWLQLPNLTVSHGSLEDDFGRGDIFVSEYSQTIIDAAKMGKLILVANFTGRRSFMKCFEDIGFPHVETGGDLAQWIRQLATSHEQFVLSQNQAVARFNSMLEAYCQAR